MNAKKYESTMKRVLKQAAAEDFSGFGDTENLCLKECVDKGYIIGIYPMVMASGRIVFDIQNPKITHAGYAFLSFRPDRRPAIAIVISVFALLVSLLAALERILANLAMLQEWITKAR